MKVIDILTEAYYIGNIPVTRTKQPMVRHKMQNKIGSGIQATAFDTRHVNSVVRVSELARPYDQNSHVEYIDMVIDHQDNPFFPKVYNAKIVKDNLGHAKLFVNMEKLTPVDHEMTADVAMQLLHNNRLVPDQFYKQFNSGAYYSLSTLFQDREHRHWVIKHTKNDQLKQALLLMEPLFTKYGSDLHGGNIMLRLTGHGAQLVFTDPFAG